MENDIKKTDRKGFATIVIVLIIIAVLAVGGVVYYKSKSSKTVPVVEENNLPQENQNSVTNTTTTCLPTTVPWIKVLSPNGGETYTADQQISMKWTSCNIKNTNNNVAIGFKNIDTGKENFSQDLSNTGTGHLMYPLSFDNRFSPGNYKVVICSTKTQAGNFEVEEVPDCSISDYSDNSFKINASVNPSINILSPSAGEKFTVGQKVTVKWTSHNIPADKLLEVNIRNSNPVSNIRILTPNGTPNSGEYTFIVGQWPNATDYEIAVGIPSGNFSDTLLIFYDISKSFTIK